MIFVGRIGKRWTGPAVGSGGQDDGGVAIWKRNRDCVEARKTMPSGGGGDSQVRLDEHTELTGPSAGQLHDLFAAVIQAITLIRLMVRTFRLLIFRKAKGTDDGRVWA